MIPQKVTIALQNLISALPEDSWVPSHIERTVTNFLPSEGDPLVEQVEAAVAYVMWAQRYPEEVGEDDKPVSNCQCRDIRWVYDPDTDGWRPCLRCNQDGYQRFEEIQSGEMDHEEEDSNV